MDVPQSLSLVTFGSHDVGALGSFYESWGWKGTRIGNGYIAFELGATRFAICGYSILEGEAPGPAPLAGLPWNGVVLSINLESKDRVEEVWMAAVDAGARPLARPEGRAWGGHSGYVADPEGHRWEIAWAS